MKSVQGRQNVFIRVYVIVLVSGFLFPPISAGEERIHFHDGGQAEQVDYHSFPPALMLRHEIGGTFRKLPKNPVLRPTRGRWDSRDVADPYLLVTADSVLLFYDGDRDDRYKIGYAVLDSTGAVWKKRGLVLSASGAAWDSHHQIAPVILPAEGGRLLYYNGNSRDDELGYRWGRAVEEEPGVLRWREARQVMLPDSGAWDVSGTVYGHILHFPEENLYRMWYTGFQGPLAAIGLAESGNGGEWRRLGAGPVLARLPGVIAPFVIYNGRDYRMYFVQSRVSGRGLSTAVFQAHSEDGRHWCDIKPVLFPDRKWEGSRLMRPVLGFWENRVYLYYCAGRGGRWRIGAAYTTAEFVPRGLWRSALRTFSGGELLLKCEIPAETALQVGWVDAATGTSYALNLEHVRNSRLGVQHLRGAFPENICGRPGYLELHLSSTNSSHSPVVHEVWVRD